MGVVGSRSRAASLQLVTTHKGSRYLLSDRLLTAAPTVLPTAPTRSRPSQLGVAPTGQLVAPERYLLVRAPCPCLCHSGHLFSPPPRCGCCLVPSHIVCHPSLPKMSSAPPEPNKAEARRAIPQALRRRGKECNMITTRCDPQISDAHLSSRKPCNAMRSTRAST